MTLLLKMQSDALVFGTPGCPIPVFFFFFKPSLKMSFLGVRLPPWGTQCQMIYYDTLPNSWGSVLIATLHLRLIYPRSESGVS